MMMFYAHSWAYFSWQTGFTLCRERAAVITRPPSWWIKMKLGGGMFRNQTATEATALTWDIKRSTTWSTYTSKHLVSLLTYKNRSVSTAHNYLYIHNERPRAFVHNLSTRLSISSCAVVGVHSERLQWFVCDIFVYLQSSYLHKYSADRQR